MLQHMVLEGRSAPSSQRRRCCQGLQRTPAARVLPCRIGLASGGSCHRCQRLVRAATTPHRDPGHTLGGADPRLRGAQNPFLGYPCAFHLRVRSRVKTKAFTGGVDPGCPQAHAANKMTGNNSQRSAQVLGFSQPPPPRVSKHSSSTRVLTAPTTWLVKTVLKYSGSHSPHPDCQNSAQVLRFSQPPPPRSSQQSSSFQVFTPPTT
jgi:hypothetical protein